MRTMVKREKIETVMTYDQWKRVALRRAKRKLIREIAQLIVLSSPIWLCLLMLMWWIIFGY